MHFENGYKLVYEKDIIDSETGKHTRKVYASKETYPTPTDAELEYGAAEDIIKSGNFKLIYEKGNELYVSEDLFPSVDDTILSIYCDGEAVIGDGTDDTKVPHGEGEYGV